MEQFEAIPKKWGNSLGITIPSRVIKKEKIKEKERVTVLVIGDSTKRVKKIFGTLKRKKSTQQMMDEIDEDGV